MEMIVRIMKHYVTESLFPVNHDRRKGLCVFVAQSGLATQLFALVKSTRIYCRLFSGIGGSVYQAIIMGLLIVVNSQPESGGQYRSKVTIWKQITEGNCGS